MKKLTLLSILFFAGGTFLLTSCDKYVKEHEQNYPHTDIATDVVTITNWTGDQSGYQATINSSALSTEAFNGGAVMCYILSGETWMAMPITLSAGQGNWITHWVYEHDASSMTIYNYDDDGLTPEPGSQTFKIVAITQAGLIAHPNVDITNYESVKKEFNL